MGSWKFIVMTLVVLIPGGSLVLLAMATAKAFVAGRDRMLRQAVPIAPAIPARRRPRLT